MSDTATSWFDELEFEAIVRLGEQANDQDFDHVFQITRNGVVDGPAGIYAPDVINNDEHDILINGVPHKATTGKGWQALDGYTGQDRYNGPCMHASEFIGGRLADDMVRLSAEAEADGEPLLWAVTEVKVPDDLDHPAGWAVLYRRLFSGQG